MKKYNFAIVSAILSAILSGSLAHPAGTSISRDAQERKTATSEYSNSHLGSPPRPLSHPDITQVITSRPGYSAEYNVRHDPPPSEEDLQRYRRNAQAESESDAYEEDDDSDMYMEPIELGRTHAKQTTVRPTVSPSPVPGGQPVAVPRLTPAARPVAPSGTEDNHQMGQHFFPSFAPVFSLGHSRPHQLFHQEPFYTSKARVASTIAADYNPFRNYRENAYKVPLNFEDEAISTNILGSGNFGVLRGGTYYNEEDEYRGFFSPHFANNGHGRPYYSNPRPQKYTNGDFFANFRDFADINTPTKASYSQYIVVYINKNGTKPEQEAEEALAAASSPKITTSITKPKNIFEQLTLLDQSDPSSDYDQIETAYEDEDHHHKKTSTHKRKLALLRQENISKQRKPHYKSKDAGKDFQEPLLALS